MAYDIPDYSQIGVVSTPAITGGAGAYNPMGAYMQQSIDPWAGYRQTSSQPRTQPRVDGPDAGKNGTLGWNMGTFDLILGGLQTIGNIWNAWEANKLAKEQFQFQKNVTNANLENQVQAYNTTLADRGRSRAFTEGQSPEEAAAYIEDNSLDYRPL